MPFSPLGRPIPPLPRPHFPTLIDALGEAPETAAVIHCLSRGICRAWVVRDGTELAACVVQADPFPAEPFAYGSAGAVWRVLRTVPGWTCVNVAAEMAEKLAERMAHELPAPPRLYGDVYFTLRTGAAPFQDSHVRRLDRSDLPLLEAADPAVRGGGFESGAAMLEDGTVAGAVVDGRLVSIAHVSVITPSYEEIGVATLDGFRNRGYATAAASIVLAAILHRHKIAIWSCGEDNAPSLKLAAKLGFEEVGRRMSVVL